MSIRKMKQLHFLCKFAQLFIILTLTPFVCGMIFKSELAIPVAVLSLLCIYIIDVNKELWNIPLVMVYLLITNFFELTDITVVERKIFSVISTVIIILTLCREFLAYSISERKKEEREKISKQNKVEGECTDGKSN